MTINELNGRLRKALPRRDAILSTDLWREIYSRDASYFNIKPLAVVRPSTLAEVEAVIAAARDAGVGVTFRTGGTSLSGQTVNDGLICELRTNWTRSEVRRGGKGVWFEPGLTANQINAILRPHGVKIGPDPASSVAAMMGGILANNSSGMEAGVKHNSYHTLRSMEFMLANGHRYDSASADDRRRFERDESELCRGLLDIRSEIIADEAMVNRIRRKYSIKNVTGYAMNSFVDFDNPMDIFIHLLVGSEGTLAFIISAELDTLPLYNTYSSAMVYFPDVTTAAASAPFLGESGAIAVEMMDYASLASVGKREWPSMPRGTTAMLIDYGAGSPEEMRDNVEGLMPSIKALKGVSHMDPFTTTVAERAALWRIRDGIFPCVAGARVPGATVVLEDVGAPVDRLDKLVEGIQNLFSQFGYDGAIFGHARDGNVHPLITSPMKSQTDIDRFASFMNRFVDHVLSLDGSLKCEHGTGRAIAPFVAREWGENVYRLMCRLKKLADPGLTLNPGVIINDDPEAYIGPMKSMDVFGDVLSTPHADKCIECGFCEHVCPTRAITLTPRQRLQAQRVFVRTGSRGLRRQYRYIGRDTCCCDGSCQMPCPMSINTGDVTDAVRERSNPEILDKALSLSARHYGGVETAIRGLLGAAVFSEKLISPYPLVWASDFLHRICDQVPHWSKFFPRPVKIQWNVTQDPDWVYFPACVTRIFGASTVERDDLITVMLRLAQRAGLKMALPRRMHGLCCSQIWEHKGDPEGTRLMANRIVEEFFELTDGGRVPIVCDTTSCSHTLFSLGAKEGVLTQENSSRYRQLKIVDVTTWLRDTVLERTGVRRKLNRILLHPTCASRLCGLDTVMEDIAHLCADEVVIPADAGCCGAAGDRGFIYPEVALSATAGEKASIEGEFDGCYSLARTCEISMQATIGRPYCSIAYLVDAATCGD